MSQCVMENKEPLTPGEEGLRDITLMMAIYERQAGRCESVEIRRVGTKYCLASLVPMLNLRKRASRIYYVFSWTLTEFVAESAGMTVHADLQNKLLKGDLSQRKIASFSRALASP